MQALLIVKSRSLLSGIDEQPEAVEKAQTYRKPTWNGLLLPEIPQLSSHTAVAVQVDGRPWPTVYLPQIQHASQLIQQPSSNRKESARKNVPNSNTALGIYGIQAMSTTTNKNRSGTLALRSEARECFERSYDKMPPLHYNANCAQKWPMVKRQNNGY